jgi:hypothetical protein
MNAWNIALQQLHVGIKLPPKKPDTRRHVKVNHESIPCVICGKSFTPRNKRSRFCSDPRCVRTAGTIAKRAERARHASA